MSRPAVTLVHTGGLNCPIRPLHDPCHAGSSEDGRTLDDMTVLSVLHAWRKQIRGTADSQGDPGREAFFATLDRAQGIIRHAPEELDWLLHAIGTVDRWLDAEVAGAYKDQPLAQDWARVCKGQEEQGESVAELILATGQNPRKGTDPDARDRLLAELADTAVTAIFAIQHFTKDEAATWHAVTQAVAKAYDRAPEAYQ